VVPVFTGQKFAIFVANFAASFRLPIGGGCWVVPLETFEASAIDCTRKPENRKILDG
jgi:hypothetical protein